MSVHERDLAAEGQCKITKTHLFLADPDRALTNKTYLHVIRREVCSASCWARLVARVAVTDNNSILNSNMAAVIHLSSNMEATHHKATRHKATHLKDTHLKDTDNLAMVADMVVVTNSSRLRLRKVVWVLVELLLWVLVVD